MKFSEELGGAQLRISAYDTRGLVVNERRYEGPVLLTPEGVVEDWRPASPEALDQALLDRLRYLALPVLTLTVVSAGFYARYLRASLLDVIHQDYVRTAWAKGLAERAVITRHALRNALIPFVTVVALHLPQLFTGAVVVETVFAWPGIGRLFWDSALRFDYPVLMGVLTIGALLVWLCNLLADVLYGYLDPRIRYS